MKRLVIALSMLAAGQAALAQPWSFTKIVDTHTLVPNGFGTFNISDAFQSVSVYGDRVTFRGRSELGRIGVYEWRGGMGRAIADQNTIVPRGTKLFGSFEDVNATSRGVTFYGSAASDNGGIFYEDGTTLGHVADRMDNIPDGNGKFVGIEFRHHSIGTATAFAGRNDASGQPFGIYRSDDGVLSRIADKTMSPPGHGEAFTAFKDWRLDGDATYISAFTAAAYGGIFRSQGGVLTKVVDSDDVDPNGHRLYTQYVRPAGANTVFNAYTDNNIEGIYIKTGSGIDKLVDETMAPPDGSSATYGGIGTLDYQNNTLIFQAGNDVIYTNYGGTMRRLIGPGDTLDGKRVIASVFDEHGFDGTTAAFWVIFAGDSSFHYDRAIYTVTIPAPSAAIFALAAIVYASKPRRRRAL